MLGSVLALGRVVLVGLGGDCGFHELLEWTYADVNWAIVGVSVSGRLDWSGVSDHLIGAL